LIDLQFVISLMPPLAWFAQIWLRRSLAEWFTLAERITYKLRVPVYNTAYCFHGTAPRHLYKMPFSQLLK